MKVVEKYVCDICRMEFATPEEADKCEKHHTIPIRVKLPSSYTPMLNEIYGVPRAVLVEMENGVLCEYLFGCIMKGEQDEQSDSM